MDGVRPEVADVFEAKDRRRQHLVALPFPEKVRAVIKLQEMVAPILRARGKMVQPWRVTAVDAK